MEEQAEKAGVTPLCQLPVRASGVLDVVDGPEDVVARLEGLGLCRGRKVTLLQKGEPTIVQVYGSRIGLAYSLASFLNVIDQPEAPASSEAAE